MTGTDVLGRLLPGGLRTEAQDLFLETAWAAGPLGHPEGWSSALRTTAATCLNSRFPMLLMAGPDLIMIYNDGYAAMLGDRHPGAMGARMDAVWSDVWPVIGPLAATVQERCEPVYAEDMMLVMGRSGYPEETYFTFSYSPVLDEDGVVVGLLDTAIETTGEVLAIRRMDVVIQLGQAAAERLTELPAAGAALLSVLARSRLDIPVAALYLLENLGTDVPEGGRLLLAGTSGAGLARYAKVIDPVTDGERAPTTLAALRGEIGTVSGLATMLPGLLRAPAEIGDGTVDTAVAMPLTTPGRRAPLGVLVMGVSPHRPLDDEYRAFHDLVAQQVSAVLGDTLAHRAELRLAEQRLRAEQADARLSAEVATTLQRAMLGPSVLPPGFAVRYVPAAEGLEVGGDWHDVVELSDGAVGVVVGDVVGRGLHAAAVMGQLRSAARAVLLQTGSPAAVLSALDAVAALVPGAAMATVFCAVLDRATGAMTFARAGHLPGVVAEPDGATRFLYGSRSLPLAVVEGGPREEDEDRLAPGSVLLLCTDGLVESRARPVDAGLDRAAAVLSAARTLPEEELADHLLDALVPGGTDDDVVVLLHRRGAVT